MRPVFSHDAESQESLSGSKLINDRFHVQQLMSEAVDQLRIHYRWEVLEAENKAIKEHRQKRKAAVNKEERDKIEKWEPVRMEMVKPCLR